MSGKICDLDEPLWSFARELQTRFNADGNKTEAETELYRISLCKALNNLKPFLPTAVKVSNQETSLKAAQDLGVSITMPKFSATGGSRRNRRRKTRRHKTRA